MTKHSNLGRSAARVAALTLAGALPLVSQAQSASDDWKFGATIYGWFPSIGGTTSFPPPSNGGPSIDVSTKQVIDALKFTFMGTLEARKGQWGAWTDLVYADFGATKSGSRDFSIGHAGVPVGVDANLNLDVKTWIWTVAGTYNLATTPEYTTDLVAGARLLDMEQTLGWQFNGDLSGTPILDRAGSTTISLNRWDGIVGVKGRANLGAERKWFVPYYADVGTGQTKLTWQAVTGLGYQFDWGALALTYRYLDYQMKSGSKVESLTLSGVALSASFTF